jgi:hypothetical protein
LVNIIDDGTFVTWPIDLKTTNLVYAEDTMLIKHGFPPGTPMFERIWTIDTKEAKRYNAKYFGKHMVAMGSVLVRPDGRAVSDIMPVLYSGGKWRPALTDVRTRNTPDKETDDDVRMLMGLALNIRYKWSVWLSYGWGPRLRFITDPHGAREAFRLRDIPEGRQRRAALRNWIVGHWRQTRDDPESASWVRKHFRGAQEFTWNDLRCRIQPSDYDLEQYEKEFGKPAS